MQHKCDRRHFVLALLGASSVCHPPAWASETPGVQVAELRDQLEKGLKARRPEEFQFLNRVISMVENQTLPLELVKSTFQWARERAKNKRYPFPYFERALRLRAAQLGIEI